MKDNDTNDHDEDEDLNTGDGRDTADEQQQFSTVNNSLDDDRRSNINTEEQQNATENLKATVNINGVAVDHFHQNSDVDEEYTSQCNNNDIHGFIAYSSDNSMIELNLKFRKCTCNENSINISKENLQDVQRSNSTGMTDSSNVPPKGISDTGVFKKEGKRKMLPLDRDNLNSLMNKLNNSTNNLSSSCTKCRLSLDVKHILKQIINTKTKNDSSAVEDSNSPCREDSYPCPPACRLTIDDSMLGLRADSLVGSSTSPLPSPNSPTPILGCLERRHSETVERRSIGIQHASKQNRKRAPLLRSLGRSIAQAEEIIIISDEFRRQSLRDQQSIRVQRSPKKISKSMESIDKRNSLTLSLQPVEIRNLQMPRSVHGVDQTDDMLTIVVNAVDKRKDGKTSKSISKSVDDISFGSDQGEEIHSHSKSSEGGHDDVELIFISEEFVKRKSKSSSDVIIVENAGSNSVEKRKISSIISNRDSSTEGRIVKSATIPVSSSFSAKTKNVRRKTTISNSNSFLTYEEPFSPETLENKDIGQLFAEASVD
ncbi:uncharacterized protein LOC128725202 [Anopheles nili]|uniref:uncharacterized protein LOC128725202 n=1 Tax=Anopheles nili TaxID=185578 RepID=UPI00237AC0FD|nr:uncharacterized protein LOC128725202 [Anopheles nili]